MNNSYLSCLWAQSRVFCAKQSANSLQDHLELETKRNELLDNRLALAKPMLETAEANGWSKKASDRRAAAAAVLRYTRTLRYCFYHSHCIYI